MFLLGFEGGICVLFSSAVWPKQTLHTEMQRYCHVSKAHGRMMPDLQFPCSAFWSSQHTHAETTFYVNKILSELPWGQYRRQWLLWNAHGIFGNQPHWSQDGTFEFLPGPELSFQFRSIPYLSPELDSSFVAAAADFHWATTPQSYLWLAQKTFPILFISTFQRL